MSLHIVTGIARYERSILLVASRYAGHREPLWTLPGGRQEPGELASETILREVLEETGISASVVELAYISESYDDRTHVVNVTFEIAASGAPRVPVESDHVVAAEWVAIDELQERMQVAVVREPLLAHLRGSAQRYFGFHEAGVSIRWE